MQIEKLAVYGEDKGVFKGIFSSIRVDFVSNWLMASNYDLIYLAFEKVTEFYEALSWIEENKEKATIIACVKVFHSVDEVKKRIKGKTQIFCNNSLTEGTLYFWGPIFEYPESIKVDDKFKVLAIMHAYNEADILEMTLEYLLSQEIDVYVVDNWSDDGTYEIANLFHEKYPERVFLERFPVEGKQDFYDWYHQLERTERLSLEKDYNWYIHYDVDEMRIAPWKNRNLREAIYYIDYLGYNLIENTVIDFKLTQDEHENIFMQDTYFDFRHYKAGFRQRKTWKKNDFIDLKKSGGHIAKIEYPRIFPLKILNRHYPFRSMEQARKKVFVDRKPRFIKEKEKLGWHGHYDYILKDEDLLTNTSKLILWNNDVWERYFISLFLGCGIQIEEQEKERPVPPIQVLGKKIILYGAGNYGQYYYGLLVNQVEIVAWIDRDYKYLPWINGKKIDSLESIYKLDFDLILIAIKSSKVCHTVRNMLIQKGIDQEKIYLIE